MESTVYTLIPPLLAILMVAVTRKVLLSLGAGIVASALMLTDFNISNTCILIWDAVKGIFISDGSLNVSNIYIILFLLILGIITAFISISGGSRAFGEWAMKHVKTRVGAQLVAALLGILIFIDDYFNALAVGQVARPITDRHQIPRAKLAYLIDSTSAPICVIMPVSSWGAYIIALIGGIFITHEVTEYSSISAFIQMIPMNFYAIAALAMVFIVIYRNWNIGSMKVHEDRAVKEGILYNPSKTVPGELKEDLPRSTTGRVGDLVIPIVTLIVGTVAAMLWTGYQAVAGHATLLTIFENTNVTKSLVLGGTIGIIVTIIMFLRQVFVLHGISVKVFTVGVKHGIGSMLPAVYILLFAWTIVDLIGRLGTGQYLAGLVQDLNLNVSFLPLLLFLIAGLMSFATGTSWGSFGILLPIAGEITAVTDITMILPAMAAVLAGAVFGDHCSPISDTTILSSTGACANHIDHVMTQIPYALISAGIAMVGYIVLGFTGSTPMGLITVVILLASFVWVSKPKKQEQLENSIIH
ncbi:Na+/H+ antiporter NhaC family protein [Pradoshia sp. D12]|uniref:Na+/H+ antiporter NhaC family protein n=1 Tax=Bacillaceae TaxID=186817 RepID=UPI00112E3307|nr:MULTISPECIES: Na+/H+ antiporter NhaC family protein [Bacillaceae]QFK70345.1 Na+/H+ antiporter NhaC family protein [Pradoshia sp. D12]TPF70454.1 Na+/H+ antiporter NhaC family protein [Bacillus sp. D12]